MYNIFKVRKELGLMPLDASAVRAVVFETDKKLCGGRIEKV